MGDGSLQGNWIITDSSSDESTGRQVRQKGQTDLVSFPRYTRWCRANCAYSYPASRAKPIVLLRSSGSCLKS